MAEKVEEKESYNSMIFRYIRAYKDWLSAHILKNRLEYSNDVTKKANDVKVNKRMNLGKRVNTHKVPSYDEWLTGRMEKAASKPNDAEGKFQHGWKSATKNGSSNIPGKVCLPIQSMLRKNSRLEGKVN